MNKVYSIAEARNQFAALVRHVEETTRPVQVTRRGQPVAVLLSTDSYKQLLEQLPKRDFWQAYLAYQATWRDVDMDIEGDIWEGVRDKSPGRDINIWD